MSMFAKSNTDFIDRIIFEKLNNHDSIERFSTELSVWNNSIEDFAKQQASIELYSSLLQLTNSKINKTSRDVIRDFCDNLKAELLEMDNTNKHRVIISNDIANKSNSSNNNTNKE